MAGGLRYEGQREENDRTENGRWWKGAACWVALMMSEGYRKREQKRTQAREKEKAAVIELKRRRRREDPPLCPANRSNSSLLPFQTVAE